MSINLLTGIGALLGGVLTGRGTGPTNKGVDLSKVLEIGSKFIPDEAGQLELKKAVLEANVQIIKSNRSLLEKVYPITFPLCTWTFLAFCWMQLYLGYKSYTTTGAWVTIPIPEFLCYVTLAFIAGLSGKWYARESSKKKS